MVYKTINNQTIGVIRATWKKVGGGDIVPLWKSTTSGGSYATNDIINYSGDLYKNLTGTDLDTTHDDDTTNWSAIVGGSFVDVPVTEQFMGYQINGRDVYQKYVSGTLPTGFANLYLVLCRVDTLLSVEGVIKRNNQPQWHSISQIGNDRDGHSGAVYQENDDIAICRGSFSRFSRTAL